MDLTIIIVNWNGGELLIRCLESIRASKTSFTVHVIVVDNNSHDGSRELAQERFPEFQIINSGANLGFGKGNNFARPLVHTPLVLFLNPDTELREDTLESAAQCLERLADVGALGCKMVYPNGTAQKLGFQWFPSPVNTLIELTIATRSTRRLLARWLPIPDPNLNGYVRKLYGGFLLIRRAALDDAGWFDERYFMYAEDVDLSRTIIDRAWKLFYCSEAEVVHVVGGTSQQAPSGFSVLMKLNSIHKLMEKYRGKWGAGMYRVAVLVGACLRLGALMPLLVVTFCQGEVRREQLQAAMSKHVLMLLWALHLRHPVVPCCAEKTDSKLVRDLA